MLTASALLPSGGKPRRYERKALQIRKFAGIKIDERLDPYFLAQCAGLRIVSLNDINGLSPEVKLQLIEFDSESWSGGASGPLSDGSRVVILNPTHGKQRQTATLMEEVCHVFLGHLPNRIGLSGQQQIGSFRDYNQEDEEEAYAVGSAALVPYYMLKRLTDGGELIERIARRYGVSRPLVKYRLKVSGLWSSYKLPASDNTSTPFFSF
jgi:Zn-dependent peptidase ImmA (M78 family)